MPTNVKEVELERIIISYLNLQNGYEIGSNADYNKEFAIDETRLLTFLRKTQPVDYDLLQLDDDNGKIKFLSRLQGEIVKRGIIDVLRNGIKIYPTNLVFFYMTPNDRNHNSLLLFESNIFSVTRQLQYSTSNLMLALDFVIFINGLPLMTFELKNNLSKQNYRDAIQQYQKDRNPKELLFSFKKCLAHVALDENEVYFTTELKGKDTFFMPFNKGNNGGAGNPVNPEGVRSDYFWKEFLKKEKVSKIVESYAQVITETNTKTNKKTVKQIFPRFHQIDVVEKLLLDVKSNGVGKRYLIQHSAGSGKSNSIAWLSHQLVDLEKDAKTIFDSVIVVTDRLNLDKQIKNTIKQFMQVKNIVGHAETSGKLKNFISDGKKIIITTVHKFPHILDDIGTQHTNNNFAIIIDEAHSSQSGTMAAKMNMVLSKEESEEVTVEDIINNIIETRKMLDNASYFAFTATPKNKTLEMFGVKCVNGHETQFKPFHTYSMKQAIEEGFIIDVLRYYTPINSYFKISKKVSDDPSFDRKKAFKKLRHFINKNQYTIQEKSHIISEHFHGNVIANGKVNGKARVMVVCSGIESAINYYYELNNQFKERKSPYKLIIAFSGEKNYNGTILTEEKINGFSSNLIEENFKEDPYRVLVVADKFQTGFDEPLLHTMYIDKTLSDIKAVQTISRLNRSYPGKNDTFTLDFVNETEMIRKSFQKYYQTTILSDETDPNRLYDLFDSINRFEVIELGKIDAFVELFLSGSERNLLDPILDVCVEEYSNLDKDSQIDFKSKVRQFIRMYNFLSAILPYGNIEWEKYSIFLQFLVKKLPSPIDNDFSEGLLESVDLDSLRIEVQNTISILLEDNKEETLNPVETGGDFNNLEPELELLSAILKTFHDMWGNIDWKDEDQVKLHISNIPKIVSKDEAYKNAMKNSDKQNAKIESQRALRKAITNMMTDNLELFKQFNDNSSFSKWLADMVFELTYNKEGKEFDGGLNI